MDLQPRPGGVARGWTLMLTLALAPALPAGPLLAQSGEEIFTTMCAACHTTTSELLIGPGLEGIQDRRDHEWLLSFITEPDRMIADGDTIAIRLLAEYQIPMPNIGTTRAQAESLLDYIAAAPAVTVTLATATQPEASGPPTEDQVLLGQALFQGTTRLANRGPTCNSCHDVTHDAVVGGGTLTTVFSRLGGPGVRAILAGPPFPVMQQAYVDRSLTEAEIAGLVAFLERADAEQALHKPRNYGITLFGAGLGGGTVLLALYSMAWGGRKRGSVHQEIFDRQVKSTAEQGSCGDKPDCVAEERCSINLGPRVRLCLETPVEPTGGQGAPPPRDRDSVLREEPGATGFEKDDSPPSVRAELAARISGRDDLDPFQPVEGKLAQEAQRLRNHGPVQADLRRTTSAVTPPCTAEFDAEICADITPAGRSHRDSRDRSSKVVP